MADNDTTSQAPERKPRRVSAAGRQDGNYTPPLISKGNGGPVPPYRPFDEPAAAAPAQDPADS